MSHDLLISYNITIQNISVCKSLQIICWIPVTVIIDQTRSRGICNLAGVWFILWSQDDSGLPT